MVSALSLQSSEDCNETKFLTKIFWSKHNFRKFTHLSIMSAKFAVQTYAKHTKESESQVEITN